MIKPDDIETVLSGHCILRGETRSVHEIQGSFSIRYEPIFRNKYIDPLFTGMAYSTLEAVVHANSSSILTLDGYYGRRLGHFSHVFVYLSQYHFIEKFREDGTSFDTRLYEYGIFTSVQHFCDYVNYSRVEDVHFS